MNLRPTPRGFTVVEVLISSVIGITIAALMVRAFTTFYRKQAELDFETRTTLECSAYLQELGVAAQQTYSRDCQVSGGILTLRLFKGADTLGERAWTKTLFASSYHSASQTLYWASDEGSRFGVSLLPDESFEFEDADFTTVAQRLYQTQVQRRTIAGVTQFEAVKSGDHLLSITLSMEDNTRENGRSLARSRTFYLSSRNNGGTP